MVVARYGAELWNTHMNGGKNRQDWGINMSSDTAYPQLPGSVCCQMIMGHLAQYGVMLPILPATDPVSDSWVEMSQYSGTESVVVTGIVNTTKINSSAMVVAPGGLTLLWFYWHPSIDGPLHSFIVF